jgi:hypothetical protein
VCLQAGAKVELQAFNAVALVEVLETLCPGVEARQSPVVLPNPGSVAHDALEAQRDACAKDQR